MRMSPATRRRRDKGLVAQQNAEVAAGAATASLFLFKGAWGPKAK